MADFEVNSDNLVPLMAALALRPEVRAAVEAGLKMPENQSSSPSPRRGKSKKPMASPDTESSHAQAEAIFWELARNLDMSCSLINGAEEPQLKELPADVQGKTVFLHESQIWKRTKKLHVGRRTEVYVQVRVSGFSRGRLRAVKQIEKPQSGNITPYMRRELDTLGLVRSSPARKLFVNSFGWYQSDDHIYITMEFLRRGDLMKYLKEHGALAPEYARDVITQVVEALEYLYSERVAHRDIKPSNILIQRVRDPIPGSVNFWVKLGDFGLSKGFPVNGEKPQENLTTKEFAAPEVRQLVGFDERMGFFGQAKQADMWSLGETMAWIFTGRELLGDDLRLVEYTSGAVPFPRDVLEEGCPWPAGSSAVTRMVSGAMKVKPYLRFTIGKLRYWLDKFPV